MIGEVCKGCVSKLFVRVGLWVCNGECEAVGR